MFRPLPFLTNPHVQTIVGNLLRGHGRPHRTGLRIVPLADGDKIAVHETAPRRPHEREPMALLVHGLGGDHRSSGIERKAHRLSALGWRVFRMDLRGAGAGARLSRRLYTAASSSDVAAVVDALIAAHPDSPLVVLGVSLGGNIVLKLAGELGADAPPNLCGVAAFGPPIDLVRCSALIEKVPFYDFHYARHLQQQVAEQERWFPDLPRSGFPPRMTLRQFDDMYTAPRWGWSGALDYYRRASALPLIGNIRVPTYILTARDDPFIAVEPFESLRASPLVEVDIAEHGGHLGFLGLDAIGGIRWGETEIINWMTRQIERARLLPSRKPR